MYIIISLSFIFLTPRLILSQLSLLRLSQFSTGAQLRKLHRRLYNQNVIETFCKAGQPIFVTRAQLLAHVSSFAAIENLPSRIEDTFSCHDRRMHLLSAFRERLINNSELTVVSQRVAVDLLADFAHELGAVYHRQLECQCTQPARHSSFLPIIKLRLLLRLAVTPENDHMVDTYFSKYVASNVGGSQSAQKPRRTKNKKNCTPSCHSTLIDIKSFFEVLFDGACSSDDPAPGTCAANPPPAGAPATAVDDSDEAILLFLSKVMRSKPRKYGASVTSKSLSLTGRAMGERVKLVAKISKLVHGTGTVAEAQLYQFSGPGGIAAFESFVDHFIANGEPALLSKARCRLLPTTFFSPDTDDITAENVDENDTQVGPVYPVVEEDDITTAVDLPGEIDSPSPVYHQRRNNNNTLSKWSQHAALRLHYLVCFSPPPHPSFTSCALFIFCSVV